MRRLELAIGWAASLALGSQAYAAAPAPDVSAKPEAEAALTAALQHIHAKEYAAAVPLLKQAGGATSSDLSLKLLLGLCYYRTGELGPAEALLVSAAGSTDVETANSARLFLGLLYRELGALDRAQVELDRAARGLEIDSHSAIGGPRRLTGSATVGVEYDGNVPLTDLGTWQSDARPSMDADALFVGSLRLRPSLAIGLQLGDTLTYRPQFLLGKYSLVHNGLWLGYRYLGARNQVQATATLGVAGLGGQPFFIDGEARAGYRRRLSLSFPVTMGVLYLGRYRNYFADEFRFFTGHTHQLQAELTFGSGAGPLTVSLGYEGIREQLRDPQAGDDPSTDYRAWAHGPWLHVRSHVQKRLTLDLWGLALMRRFDALPATGIRREDQYLTADLSLTVEAKRWLEFFVGGAAIYNGSTDALFRYLKPLAYLGATFSFSAW